MNIDKQNKLAFFQNLYEEANNKDAERKEELKKWKDQYEGSKEIDGDEAKDAAYCRNITFELIESQISTYIPPAKIVPYTFNKTNHRRAQMLERYLHNLMDKLPSEILNDLEERDTLIYGGSITLVEWDNSVTTHNTIGSPVMNILDPLKFTPQPFVYNIKEMEYCFTESEDTHENLERKYGVSFEKAQETTNQENPQSTDTCTVITCFYRDDKDNVCKYIWADDVELEDIEDYWGRYTKKCSKCGKVEGLCKCENPQFEVNKLDYETVDKPKQFFFDYETNKYLVNIMPESAKLKDGIPIFETEARQLEANGTPAMQEINGVLLPVTVEQQTAKTKETRIPFYKPSLFPIVIRKNISSQNSIFGQSDCKFIRDQQQTVNKLESRINEKSINSGVAIISGDDTRFEISDEIYKKGIKVKNIQQKNLLDVLDLRVDTTRDEARSEKVYQDAKSTLGISDSYQGKADSTAQSGVAKQAQIMQSGGRLESKKVMKQAAYAEKYEILLQLSLAYADEPRPIAYQDVNNEWQGDEFNKYAFLEIDKAGKWYYNDEFIFSVDKVADVGRNREVMWTETRNNFVSGAFGNPAEIDTLIFYWQAMDKLHYPEAASVLERLTQRKAQRAAMAQQMVNQQQQTVNNGGVNNGTV